MLDNAFQECLVEWMKATPGIISFVSFVELLRYRDVNTLEAFVKP